MKVALKDHMKMASTGENMVRKTSLVPNIQGENNSHYYAKEKIIRTLKCVYINCIYPCQHLIGNSL